MACGHFCQHLFWLIVDNFIWDLHITKYTSCGVIKSRQGDYTPSSQTVFNLKSINFLEPPYPYPVLNIFNESVRRVPVCLLTISVSVFFNLTIPCCVKISIFFWVNGPAAGDAVWVFEIIITRIVMMLTVPCISDYDTPGGPWHPQCPIVMIL